FGPTGRTYQYTDGQFNYHAANFVYNTAYKLGREVPAYPPGSFAVDASSYNNTAETFRTLVQSNRDGGGYFSRFFDVIVWPGQEEPFDIRQGDLLLRGPEPGADFGHLAIICDSTLRDMT